MKLIRFYPILVLSLLFTASSCGLKVPTLNYSDPRTPRYADFNIAQNTPQDTKTFKILSYNIRRAEEMHRAIDLLKENQLDTADIICLQEMDKKGVEQIAHSFKLNYVYYPAALHGDKDFGNAILTKWPITDDTKIILPHLNLNKAQRVAVGATISVHGQKVRIYSVHIGVILKTNERRDQAEAIIDSIPPDVKHVVIAGDFNTLTRDYYRAMIDPFMNEQFTLASKDIGWTYKHWYFLNKKATFDHILTRGMRVLASGKIEDRGPSDHLPIWVEVEFKE